MAMWGTREAISARAVAALQHARILPDPATPSDLRLLAPPVCTLRSLQPSSSWTSLTSGRLPAAEHEVCVTQSGSVLKREGASFERSVEPIDELLRALVVVAL